MVGLIVPWSLARGWGEASQWVERPRPWLLVQPPVAGLPLRTFDRLRPRGKVKPLKLMGNHDGSLRNFREKSPFIEGPLGKDREPILAETVIWCAYIPRAKDPILPKALYDGTDTLTLISVKKSS